MFDERKVPHHFFLRRKLLTGCLLSQLGSLPLSLWSTLGLHLCSQQLAFDVELGHFPESTSIISIMNYSKTHLNHQFRVLKQNLKAIYFSLSTVHILLWLPRSKENRSICYQLLHRDPGRRASQGENERKHRLVSESGQENKVAISTIWRVLNLMFVSLINKGTLENV